MINEDKPLYRYMREVIDIYYDENFDTNVDLYLKSIAERNCYIINYEEERREDKLIIYVIIGRLIH